MDLTKIDREKLSQLTPEERKVALGILEQYAKRGESSAFDELVYQDYAEIPADIETFLYDKQYLGNGLIDPEGRFTVFPYWVDVLKKIFPDRYRTNYNTLILTGSIGIGKSFMAVLCMLYLLHRMLCLKDPYTFYGLQPIDKITFSLINVTIDAAKGVAWDKLQQLVQSSDWFMTHGKISGRSSLVWVPDKRIELVVGSNNNSVIGRAVFCLDGDTKILTSKGEYKLSECSDKEISVVSVDSNGKLIASNACYVRPTLKSKEEYCIELDDGTVIRCTPSHRFMLIDGSYKKACELTEEDELFNIDITYDDYIQYIINTRGQWNISNDEYFEVHHILPKCLGGKGDCQKCRRGEHHPNLIFLYPREHFIAHMLLTRKYPNDKRIISAWSMMAFPKGKTKRDYPITPIEYEELRNKCRLLLKGNSYGKGRKPWNTGLTKETDSRLSMLSLKQKDKLKGRVVSPETRERMSIATRKRYAEHPEQRYNHKTNKGKILISCGDIAYYIDKNSDIPEGWVRGDIRARGKKKDTTKYHTSKAMQERRKFLSSGKNNNMYGKGYKLAGGNNGKAIYIYTFEGTDYQCRDDLIRALKPRWPSISESAIRRIMKGKYTKRITNKYQYIIDNLVWRLKSNENKKN